MDDLSLWRLLDAETLDAGALVPLLEELAGVPALERAPWLGRISRALRDPSASLRAAALAALDDATGPLAVREVVRALDDGDASVQLAAVRALRSIAARQPARFAHALFHPSPAVRAAALEEALPPATTAMAFHLYADPACASRLVALGVRPLPQSLGALLDFVRDGQVGASLAREWIAELRPQACLDWASTAPSRSTPQLARVMASEGHDAPGHDLLDDLFRLFCRDGEDDHRARFFRAWTEHLRSCAAPLCERVVASLVVAMRLESFAEEALGLAVNHEPTILSWRSIPRATRLAAVDAIYREGPRRAADDATLEALAECDLSRRERGGLDLRFLGALLCFRRSERYRWLIGRVGIETIATAFLRDIEHAAPFLSIPDRSTEGRAYVFERIAERAVGAQRALVRAIYVVSAESDLSSIAAWPPHQRVELFDELLSIEHHPTLGFDADRAKPLAYAIALPDLAGREADLLERWLRRKDHVGSQLGRATLRRMAQTWKSEPFVRAIAGLPVFLLRRALELIATTDALTFAQERALAELLVDSSSPRVAEWAEARLPKPEAGPVPAFALAPGVHALPEWLAAKIRTVPDLDDGTIQRCHGAPCTGLVAAMRARTAPPRPSVGVAVALLGCHDPAPEVAKAFAQHTSSDPGFLTELDAAAVAAWQGSSALPPHGDAWLWRFERHAFAAASAMIATDLTTSLRAALALDAPLLTEHLWAAAASAFGMWRYRDGERLLELVDERLVDLCVEQLDTSVGRSAARMLAAMLHASAAIELLETRRERIRALLPDLADEVRDELRPFVSMHGLPSRARGAREGVGKPGEDLLRRIAASRDLDELEQHCRSTMPSVVHEAALRLVMIGDEGCLRIAALLAEEPAVTHLSALTASVALWPDGEAVLRVRRLLALGSGTPELRFRIAIALVERGDEGALPTAVEMARAPNERAWLARRDVEKLERHAPDRDELARALAISPQPHAYLWAIPRLVEREPAEGPDADALRAFLARGRGRERTLRVEAATWLREIDDLTGFPLIAAARIAGHTATRGEVLAGAPPEIVIAMIEGALTAGGAEQAALDLLTPAVDRGSIELALERLLSEADDVRVRAAAVQRLPRRPTRSIKLRQLAEIFAWGMAVGRELTGRVVRVHLIASDDYGYTRLSERRVFVTPLPLLRGERRGREVVEGLVLHELGHQRHHAGPDNGAVWARADAARLGRLLNLVADEHLERNLRALDATYGDRLKRLASYAFQHADREIAIESLLRVLGSRALSVLSACRLTAARRANAVRVETGAVLGELERAGSSFAKFVRALRMGLGSRHGDAKVDEALALFDRAFKRADMHRLWEITLELHRIFGADAALADLFGGAESLEDSLHDRVTAGEGIADADVQEEVERILGPPSDSARAAKSGGPRKLAINVGSDASFDLIHEVVHVAPSPEQHRAMARQVSRHARRLRGFLERLGLAYEPQRMRLSGRRLDTTRIRPLVTHGDPRFLLARETRRKTDLHLGMIVDCSGSMQGASMERAHAFGVLLAEAVRGMRGVDLRIFGFDDRQIFDAGDARRPAVTSLAPGGGNNDAAGLWHAARVAMTSPRKAKVLVMISDGLPTECSVEALRALVRRLTRRHGLCCAQVAVRPIEEVCFPHYVEVDEDNLDAAVRRFGSIVAGLVGRTMKA